MKDRGRYGRATENNKLGEDKKNSKQLALCQ